MSDEESKSLSQVSQAAVTNQGEGPQLRLQELLRAMIENNASDLHITQNSPPVMRVDGEIVRVKTPPLKPGEIKKLFWQMLNAPEIEVLEKNLEIDLSFEVEGLARFRVNIFHAKNGLAGSFRAIPSIIPSVESLSLPKILLNMVNVNNGLILVTGPTGSGKSTTLAALVNYLNMNEKCHIITLEDPIEFIHEHKKSIVNQREIGTDTLSFQKGLKSLLRQDPDIVLVGELRDVETIEAALTIAETGHLVFATLHTNSTVQTINRIINVFPAHQQSQIMTLLSFVVQGIVAQQLIPKSFTKGRSLAMEILFPTSGIRNLIREKKVHQIYSQMQIGQDTTGMVTMNQSLMELLRKGAISQETAMAHTASPQELSQMVEAEIKSRKAH